MNDPGPPKPAAQTTTNLVLFLQPTAKNDASSYIPHVHEQAVTEGGASTRQGVWSRHNWGVKGEGEEKKCFSKLRFFFYYYFTSNTIIRSVLILSNQTCISSRPQRLHTHHQGLYYLWCIATQMLFSRSIHVNSWLWNYDFILTYNSCWKCIRRTFFFFILSLNIISAAQILAVEFSGAFKINLSVAAGLAQANVPGASLHFWSLYPLSLILAPGRRRVHPICSNITKSASIEVTTVYVKQRLKQQFS